MADAVHTAIGFNDPFTWLVTRITPANMAEIPESRSPDRAPESCTGKNDRQRGVCLGNRGCVRALHGVVWPVARR